MRSPTNFSSPSTSHHSHNIMPSPPPMPWNSINMPWTISSPYSGVMEFNAIATTPQSSFQLKNQPSISLNGHKRKSDIPLPSPSKQFITEEKMAAHLNGLHISPDYISHESVNPNGISSEMKMESDNIFEYSIPMSPKDLEEKLKNANRITICDEIKKFHENDSILPKALLSRFEKPCTALVLWQPPQKITDLIVTTKNKKNNYEFDIDDDDDDDDNNGVNGNEDQQNNNTSTLDYNYGMETDMI